MGLLMCGSLLQKFQTCPLSLAVHQPGGVLGLTSDSCPAQRPVLSQDSAHGVPVVVQRHGPLGAEPLLVVPHEGAVADLGSCRGRGGDTKTAGGERLSGDTVDSGAAGQESRCCACLAALRSELEDCSAVT